MIAIAIALYSCGKAPNLSKNSKNHTPKVYRMSQREKEEVNYDFRENKKLVETNLKHKEENLKALAIEANKTQKELNELNQKSSKNKKDKSYQPLSFSFYH